MAIYLMSLIDIHDRVEYDKYAALAGPIFMREGVRVLGNDEAPSFMGDVQADKAVLLEFRDKAHLKAFFALSDYAEAAKHRDAGTTMRVTRFNKFEIPKT